MWLAHSKYTSWKAYKIFLYLVANSLSFVFWKGRGILEDIRKIECFHNYNNGNFEILKFENCYYWVERKICYDRIKLKVQISLKNKPNLDQIHIRGLFYFWDNNQSSFSLYNLNLIVFTLVIWDCGEKLSTWALFLSKRFVKMTCVKIVYVTRPELDNSQNRFEGTKMLSNKSKSLIKSHYKN